METKGFIKNEDMLQEDYQVEDWLDFSEIIDKFSKRLDNISKSSVIGLIGKYGSGKSTMLHQIATNEDTPYKWIHFDAWKYPERKDMWEGFVIDFASQVDKMKETVDELDGKGKKDKALDTVSVLATMIPGLPSNLLDVFKSSPARRVFEFQHVLTKLIEEVKDKVIVIVVEDIDRSGDYGIYFLETLKQFIRSVDTKKKILVVAPISDYNENAKKVESYRKCLDYQVTFEPELKGLEKYLENVIREEMFVNLCLIKQPMLNVDGVDYKPLVVQFCEGLMKEHGIDIRTLKHIIRNANLSFLSQRKSNFDPDWRVSLCLEAAKSVVYDPEQNLTYFSHFLSSKKLATTSIFSSFLGATNSNIKTIKADYSLRNRKWIQPQYVIKIIEDDIYVRTVNQFTTALQVDINDKGEKVIVISDSYFK